MGSRSCYQAILFAITAIIIIIVYIIYIFNTYGTWPSLAEIFSQIVASTICSSMIVILCIFDYNIIAWIVTILFILSSGVTSAIAINNIIKNKLIKIN